MSTTYQTRHSLLQRATNLEDDFAWEEFVGQYRHFILCVLYQLGVPSNEAEDLSQQILIELTRALPRYDRSRAGFRTWLNKIIRNKANSYFRQHYSTKKKLANVSNDRDESDEIKTPDIEGIIEKEWAAYVASLAMGRVRKAFKGQAVDVFEMSLDGHSTTDIAKKTNLTTATVYTLKKRVKKRLYLEIRQLAFELEN